MTLRTVVGFVADFPIDHGADDSAPGRLLADFLAAQLKSSGIETVGPYEREGWAWDISANVDGIPIVTIVGLVGDMDSTPPRQWLVTNEASFGIWSRLFCSRTKREQAEVSLRRYCEALHAILVSDDSFSHLLWYDIETFDRPGDKPEPMP
jgi:hypothetical protein